MLHTICIAKPNMIADRWERLDIKYRQLCVKIRNIFSREKIKYCRWFISGDPHNTSDIIYIYSSIDDTDMNVWFISHEFMHLLLKREFDIPTTIMYDKIEDMHKRISVGL
jgi:Zn-dependent peptidase ImmA (M78 family)